MFRVHNLLDIIAGQIQYFCEVDTCDSFVNYRFLAPDNQVSGYAGLVLWLTASALRAPYTFSVKKFRIRAIFASVRELVL